MPRTSLRYSAVVRFRLKLKPSSTSRIWFRYRSVTNWLRFKVNHNGSSKRIRIHLIMYMSLCMLYIILHVTYHIHYVSLSSFIIHILTIFLPTMQYNITNTNIIKLILKLVYPILYDIHTSIIIILCINTYIYIYIYIYM